MVTLKAYNLEKHHRILAERETRKLQRELELVQKELDKAKYISSKLKAENQQLRMANTAYQSFAYWLPT